MPAKYSGASDHAYVSVADSPNGPWTRAFNNSFLPVNVTGSWTGGITNPAPFINADGSVLLYFAGSPCPPGWGLAPNCIGMATAPSWEGPYQVHAAPAPITRPESEVRLRFALRFLSVACSVAW